MKRSCCFLRKCSIFCYDHRCLDRHCIQCYRSWKEVCRFISEIGCSNCKCK